MVVWQDKFYSEKFCVTCSGSLDFNGGDGISYEGDNSTLAPTFPVLLIGFILISVFEGLSQLTSSSVSAGGMSGGESGVGRFSSSLKCSAHHFSCSLVVVSGFPFLSITGLSVC